VVANHPEETVVYESLLKDGRYMINRIKKVGDVAGGDLRIKAGSDQGERNC